MKIYSRIQSRRFCTFSFISFLCSILPSIHFFLFLRSVFQAISFIYWFDCCCCCSLCDWWKACAIAKIWFSCFNLKSIESILSFVARNKCYYWFPNTIRHSMLHHHHYYNCKPYNIACWYCCCCLYLQFHFFIFKYVSLIPLAVIILYCIPNSKQKNTKDIYNIHQGRKNL